MAASRALTAKDEKAVAKAYAKGARSSELAEKYGVHRTTIRNIVERQGGTLRARGGVRTSA